MADRGLLSGRVRPGTLLGGRYEVWAQIGRGGMAEVYEAVDRLLSRRVAVKVLLEASAEDQRVLARFHREARAAASLSHPNIVAVHDAGVDGDRPYLVMELVSGRSLAELMGAEAPFAPHRAAAIAGQIATALAYAHSRGVVHRDVSPGNVMVTPTADVKVLDFGIARVLSWTPVTGSPTRHGTAAYLSPEQARGDAADERSDIYALGAVLYEMLTGRPPFTGDSSVTVAYRHLHEVPIRPSSLAPAVPPALDRAVIRCLAKDPAARYQRARDLMAELARIRNGTPDRPGAAGGTPTSTLEVAADATSPVSGPRKSPRAPGTTSRLGTTPLATPPRGAARHRAGPASRARRVAVGLALTGTLVGSAVWLGMAALADRPSPGRQPGQETESPPPPLYAPTAISAAGTCDGFLKYRVDLSWSPSDSELAAGYQVLRSDEPGGPYELVVRISGRDATRFSDRGLGVESTYYYVVRSVAEGRRGPPSSEVAAETPLLCLF
jgi:eukaryotic-like serine/threonine-protein kinase